MRLAVLLLLVACADRPAADAPLPDTGEAEWDPDVADTGPDTAEPEPTCGDDHVDTALGEDCDDGNRRPFDGCTADCRQRYVCGDGLVHPEEQCDDAGAEGGCTDFCRLEPYVQLTLGRTHACALGASGAVTCWGDGSPLDPTPRSAWASGQGRPPSGTYTALAAGAMTTCGLRPDGTLTCWGDPEDWRTEAPSGAYEALDQYWFGCALDRRGDVTCWGTVDGDPGRVHDEPDGPFVQVATYGHGACALRRSGELVCWGFDTGPESPPAGDFAQVACGERHCCALTDDGEARCWGSGQAELAAPDVAFASVAAGSQASCGIDVDRKVHCWGEGVTRTPPGRFTQVDVGWRFACALRLDGDVLCWGAEDEGQTWAP